MTIRSFKVVLFVIGWLVGLQAVGGADEPIGDPWIGYGLGFWIEIEEATKHTEDGKTENSSASRTYV